MLLYIRSVGVLLLFVVMKNRDCCIGYKALVNKGVYGGWGGRVDYEVSIRLVIIYEKSKCEA